MSCSAVAPASPESSCAAAEEPAGQAFLTCRIGGVAYGFDILKVQEIRGYEAVTQIVNAPAFIKGVIDLRGTIVPIVDLRIRFGISAVSYDTLTAVIVLNLSDRVVGVVVDSVSDVVLLASRDIRPAPAFGSAVDTHYILGLGFPDSHTLILVDAESLLAEPDMRFEEAPGH